MAMNKGKKTGPTQRRHKTKRPLRRPLLPKESAPKTPWRPAPRDEFPEVDGSVPEE